MTVAAFRFDNALRRRPEDDERQRYLTPPYLLEPIRELLGGIELDPCTEPDNPTGADRFYCPPADGCALPWDARTIFCNPPYGGAKDRWVDRCIAESIWARIVLLVPAHTDTRIFQAAFLACDSCLLLKGRVKFGTLRPNRRQEAASHGATLFGFGVDLIALADLGAVAIPARRNGGGQ
jgi:DNA N-6-adenine-methyltransferase (Dam)